MLEKKQVERLGSSRSRSARFRLIAATNESLEQLVNEGKFRQDLVERVVGYEIQIPPLRERKDDILPLIRHFLAELRAQSLTLADETLSLMLAYAWPGNIRQLKQAIGAMVAFAETSVLTPDLLPKRVLAIVNDTGKSAEPRSDYVLKDGWPEIEERLFRAYVERCRSYLGGRVSIRSLAELSKVPRSTLATRLARAGIVLK